MKDELVTGAEIRRFLLGDVGDDMRERIESLFISDPASRERILIAENELIEDYLEDSLTASDKARFLAQYRHTPHQRRKLRIAKSIKEHAIADTSPGETATLAVPQWRIFLSALRPRNPMIFVPVAAVVTIVTVVAVVWLLQFNNKRTQEINHRLEIERELGELNASSSPGQDSREILSIVLPPVSVRSVGPQTELTPGTGASVIELHLLWTQRQQYPSYRATLRRVGNTEQFTIANLHTENTLDGSVRLRVPAHILTRGFYQVTLSGIASDGAQGTSEEYNFTVAGSR